jgi:hypothetical protein
MVPALEELGIRMLLNQSVKIVRGDRTTFSQIWLNEYLAKNPFVKREPEEKDPANEHEIILATGTDATGNEVVNTKFTVVNATDIKPEQLTWLWPEPISNSSAIRKTSTRPTHWGRHSSQSLVR